MVVKDPTEIETDTTETTTTTEDGTTIVSAKGIISGIGNKDTSNNIQLAEMKANYNKILWGDEAFITYDAPYFSPSINNESQVLTIGKGVIHCRGYIGYLDKAAQFYLTAPATGTIVYHVIVEFNTTIIPNTFEVKLVYTGNSSFISLYKNPIEKQKGIYQQELYTLKVSKSDTIGIEVETINKRNFVTRLPKVIRCESVTSQIGAYATGTTKGSSSNDDSIATTAFVHKVLAKKNS